MGQEVKNLLRAQSKYGLMESSAKTGKKIFDGSQEQFLDKTVIWDRTPPSYTSTAVFIVGRAQGSQILKRNSIISICSKVMAFLVILLSPWSPRCPRRPHVIPVSSLCHPHIIHIAPRRSPCGPHGLWSPWSPWSPHVVPTHVVPTHVVPVVPTSSPSSPRRPHIV